MKVLFLTGNWNSSLAFKAALKTKEFGTKLILHTLNREVSINKLFDTVRSNCDSSFVGAAVDGK
jgi:hypothetical protein